MLSLCNATLEIFRATKHTPSESTQLFRCGSAPNNYALIKLVSGKQEMKAKDRDNDRRLWIGRTDERTTHDVREKMKGGDFA